MKEMSKEGVKNWIACCQNYDELHEVMVYSAKKVQILQELKNKKV